MISIEHSHAAGTVVCGTDRGDGTNHVITALGDGWRFSRNIGTGAWYLPRSRDHHADQPRISRLATALRATGHTVEIHIDDTRRSPAQIEADRAANVADRVERYTALADTRISEGAARLDQVRARRSAIPLGQPVIGARDASVRRRLNRAEDIARDHLATGQHWQHRAEAATSTQRYRHSPRVITRRIQRLDAELRRWQRSLTTVRGDAPTERHAAYLARAEQEIAVLRDEADYWRHELAALHARGLWRSWTPQHFRPGDEVLIGGAWYPVVRVNRKTLTVPPKIFLGQRRPDAHGAYPWTDTAPYDTVFGRRRDGRTLHHPPPDPDATCTEPTTAPPASSIPPGSDRDAETCTQPPVARVTVHHDGDTCGCIEPCLDSDGDGDESAAWMEIRLLCAAHAKQYQRVRPTSATVTGVTWEDLI